jgi:predicted RNase H-like HicB family nuclease
MTRLTIELEQDTDGRWVAEVRELPGVLVYGATATEALQEIGREAVQHLQQLTDQRGSGERRRSSAIPASPRVTAELPVVMTADDDGGYVVECPVILGCISQGQTRLEALSNIREAIALCLRNRRAERWTLPDHVEVMKLIVDVSSDAVG